MSATLDNDLRELARLFDAARYPDCEAAATRLVQRHPACGNGWKILGRVRLMLARDALAVLHRAAALLPDDGEAQHLLAVALHQAGHPELALPAYERALTLAPGNASAHRQYAAALVALGRLAPAADAYRRLLARWPAAADAHLDLGNVLRGLGQRSDALASYRRAIAIDQNYAEAYFNLGVVLGEANESGDPGEPRAFAAAIASYRRALACDPQHARAHLNLGNVFARLARYDEARTSYDAALALDAGYAEAWLGLGNAFAAQGQTAPALDAYRQALAARPGFAAALLNLGNAQKDQGLFDEALTSYRQAISSAPDFYIAHNNLIYTQALIAGQDPQTTYADTVAFGRQVARHIVPYADWANTPLPQRRLRIGLVSGDLRNHPVGHFIESVLGALRTHHDVEVTAYANNPPDARDDDVSARLAGLCHRWRAITGVDDATVARRIRDDAIDILVDLSGHIERNRLPLFACKAAPVQASWLGFQGSTGISAIDYIVADRWTVPPAHERFFTETVWRLPATLWCLTPPDVELEPSPLPALARGYVTFGCFNRIEKINPAVFALWARVLHSVAHSRLLLKAPELAHDSVRRRIIAGFAAQGIGEERLDLAGTTPRAEHLAAYRDVDVALDPFPYAGATTTVEALWMGVPTVTLAGQRFIERQGVSLLMNAGLAQCIAADPGDYLARVLTLVDDLPALALMRGELRARVMGSPLFDARRFADDICAAWRGMWQRWCSTRSCAQETGRALVSERPRREDRQDADGSQNSKT